jgi:hypothetical protein
MEGGHNGNGVGMTTIHRAFTGVMTA